MGDASAGGSLEGLRRLNRLRVIGVLRDETLVSRAEIARRTGLSRSTVSSLVAELQDEGLVVEHDGQGADRRTGRPPILLAFDPSAGAALGIAFDHASLRVAVSDLSSRVLAERTLAFDVDHAAHEAMDAAAALAQAVLDEAEVPSGAVMGAGVGLPGPVAQATGEVASATILPGWVGIAVLAELRDRLGVPVLVDNDVNLGALAEAADGAGRDETDLLYVMLGEGIGAGLVLNGRPYRGKAGFAGELGHVLADPAGVVCRCGNRGCLETVAAGPALLDLLRRSHGDALTTEGMLALAREGDVGCRRVIADAGRAVGEAVAGICNLLNPGRVVVGGELAAAGDLLLDGIRETLRRAALPAATQGLDVEAGVLGDRAVVLGALALVVSAADHAQPTRLATGGAGRS